MNKITNLKEQYIKIKGTKDEKSKGNLVNEFLTDINITIMKAVLAAMILLIVAIRLAHLDNQSLIVVISYKLITTVLIITVIFGSFLWHQKFKYDKFKLIELEKKIEKSQETVDRTINNPKKTKTSLKTYSKESLKLYEYESYKRIIQARIALSAFHFLVYFVIIQFIVINNLNVIGGQLRAFLALAGFAIAINFLVDLLRMKKWGFIISVLLLIATYLFLIITGALIFGTYYYLQKYGTIQESVQGINDFFLLSFKYGSESFFNFSTYDCYDVSIIHFVQFIYGKILEWVFLGCFSGLFITKMTSKLI